MLSCCQCFLVFALSHTDISMRLALFSYVLAALSIQQAVAIPSGMYSICIFRIVFYCDILADISILQFALTLEHIEVAYYTIGTQLFNESTFIAEGYNGITHRRFREIFEHEKAHVELLSGVLGKQAPQPCNYSLCVFFL